MDGEGRRGGGGERVSLFSLSAVLKTPPPPTLQCVSSVDDPPPLHLIQTHAPTICTAGLS